MSERILPRFGVGTAAIGNLYRAVSDNEARATIAAALGAGIAYFDTAPHYGFGLAERRLGDALADLDAARNAMVSTKVGRLLVPTGAGGERHCFVDADPFEGIFDYSADGIRRSVEGSTGRLRGRRIDMLLAHDLGRLTHGADHPRHLRDFLDGGYGAMVDLRATGMVGAIGIGVNEVAICDELLDRVELDIILIAGRYTLLDRSAGALLDRCAALGVRVIVGGPYNSGILAGDPGRGSSGGARYDYAPPPPAMIERTRTLAAICAAAGVPLSAAAIHFPLRHPAVASVVAGVVGMHEVDSLAAGMGTIVPAALWDRIDGDDGPAPPQVAPSERLILLHPDDNVLICVSPISAGDVIPVSGGTIPAREGVTVGHKVARSVLSAGDKVIKYGAPIGSMTAAAATGEWVHMHNMKSDYIASHTRTVLAGDRT